MFLPDFAVPLIVGFTIQIFKLIIDFIEEKRFNIDFFWRAGGFPSVHSGISSSITVLMLMKYSYTSPEFAIAFIFSFLFWYDAMNVRYEAGKHAKYINKISYELQNILNFNDHPTGLKERLGHTFIEVIGGISIGSILAFILVYITK